MPDSKKSSSHLQRRRKQRREIPELDFVLAELDAAANVIEKHFATLHPARAIPTHLQRTFDRLNRALYRAAN